MIMQGKKKISTPQLEDSSKPEVTSQPAEEQKVEDKEAPQTRPANPAETKPEAKPVTDNTEEEVASPQVSQIAESSEDKSPKVEQKAPPTVSHGSTKKIGKSALAGKYSVPKVDSLIKKVEGGNKAREEAKRENSYTEEELKKHWEEYKAEREKEGKDRQVNLMSQPFTLENDTISIVLSNVLLADMLDSFKVDLMEYLRDKVENDYISITAVIKEEEKGRMLYTNREKFDHMASKSPSLKKLQERLGLDPDY
jgi:DNA polymerase-3 subunit gamma/tau